MHTLGRTDRRIVARKLLFDVETMDYFRNVDICDMCLGCWWCVPGWHYDGIDEIPSAPRATIADVMRIV